MEGLSNIPEDMNRIGRSALRMNRAFHEFNELINEWEKTVCRMKYDELKEKYPGITRVGITFPDFEEDYLEFHIHADPETLKELLEKEDKVMWCLSDFAGYLEEY